MAKIDSFVKEEISRLSKTDLEKLVIKAASNNRQFHDYLIINYIDKVNGENELFEQTKKELEILFSKNYKGFSEELQLANMLANCNKKINEFAKVCKDKLLEIPFSMSTNHFTTCFTRYNQQVYLFIKKAITIFKNKLHEDFYIQFAPKLNVLHRTSNHLDYIHSLPISI